MLASINGTELFYELHGQGPPMLVMHGGPGWDHGYFRPSLDALASYLQLIYYDHRGNGRSSREVEWDEVDHALLVEDADALRQHLGHEKILLLGHSYGGFLAQEYALRFPDRVAGLILCSTAPALDYPEKVMANAEARGTPEMLAGVGEVFSGGVSSDERFAEVTQTILPLYFHRFDPASAAGMFSAHSYSSAAFNRAITHCAPSFSTLARLHEIRVPTLLISGTDDWIMPLAEAVGRLRSEISHAHVELIEGTGHFPFLEEPYRFALAVRSWLASRELTLQQSLTC